MQLTRAAHRSRDEATRPAAPMKVAIPSCFRQIGPSVAGGAAEVSGNWRGRGSTRCVGPTAFVNASAPRLRRLPSKGRKQQQRIDSIALGRLAWLMEKWFIPVLTKENRQLSKTGVWTITCVEQLLDSHAGTKRQEAERSRKQQFDDTIPVPARALSGANLDQICAR